MPHRLDHLTADDTVEFTRVAAGKDTVINQLKVNEMAESFLLHLLLGQGLLFFAQGDPHHLAADGFGGTQGDATPSKPVERWVGGWVG